VFAFLRKRLQGFFERHPSLELAGALLFIVLGLGVLLLNPEGEGRYGISDVRHRTCVDPSDACPSDASDTANSRLRQRRLAAVTCGDTRERLLPVRGRGSTECCLRPGSDV
jgi:hypothetical protein